MTSQAAEITKDFLLDRVEETPLAVAAAAAAAAFSNLKKRRQIQDFLKKSGPAPPTVALKPTLAIPKTPMGPLAKAMGFLKLAGAYAPAASGVIEGTKGLYLIGKAGAREGHAEAGEKLMKRPKAVQAGKILFDTADSMSKYGAAMEARDVRSFREKNNIPTTYPDMMTLEQTREMEKRKGMKAKDIRELLARSGSRPDGTPKGVGYFGEIKLPDGGVATEYSTQSDAVKVGGKRIDFPSLVPTLTADELKNMTEDVIPNKKPIPEAVMQKAIDHARLRLGEGKSVFRDK